jgi:monovalent cation:H+ antiporter-2, CPA2 family
VAKHGAPNKRKQNLSDLHTFEVFAEVGVVLLMFSIGVEFSISDLRHVKWVA